MMTPDERPDAAQGENAAPDRPVDEKGRPLVDEFGEPIHWATPKERLLALLGALVVIAITIAFAYSLSTGDLFRR